MLRIWLLFIMLMLLMGMTFLLMVFYQMLVMMFILLERILLMVHWLNIYLMVFLFFGVVLHVTTIDIVLTQQVLIFIGFVVPFLYSPIRFMTMSFLIACLILNFQSLEWISRGSMVDNHLNLSMSTLLLGMFSAIYRIAQ
jgi:hypothetical protein